MRIPSSPNTPSILVGRDRELGLLHEHLDATLAGTGSLVLIGGEAGIGKTALAEAVCREASEQGTLVLIGRCYDLTETPPYGPWVELFGAYRQEGGMPSLPDAFARPGMVGEVTSQPALFRKVRDFFTTLGASRPTLILLDDLHWADPASLDLLRSLARLVGTLPLLLIMTYRADELTRRHPLSQMLPLLVRESGAERLDLRALDDAAIHVLIAARYRLPTDDAKWLVAHLQARAEGNTLFVGEVLRALEETGALREEDGKWGLDTHAEASVPPLLRAVIDARIARLAEATQHLLQIVAVIGHAVPFSLWAMVAGTDEDALLDAVAEAEAAHMMVEVSDGASAIFAHALIREAIYAGIRPSQRRRWHRAVGEALAAQPDSDPDAVAYHFQRAMDDRAAAWLVTAGERAQRAYAWLTATERYEAALALAGDAADAGTRGWLLFRCAVCRRYAHPDQALVNLEAAATAATAAGDAMLLARTRLYQGLIR